MSVTRGDHNTEEFEPRLGLARQQSNVAHGVVIRLKEMGLPDSFDKDLASLSTDLGDLWGAQKILSDQVADLVGSDAGWQAIADILVDLRSSVDHVAWHIKSVRRPLNRITTYAYRRAASEELEVSDV